MLLIKLCYHISSFFSKTVYKLIYGSRFKVGKGTTWRKHLSVMIDKSGRVEIGEGCFFNNYCSVNSNGSIVIGENTIFGENVKIYDHNHRFKSADVAVRDQGFSNGKVKIGKNCWIGSNVIILKGADIGDHCVIGSGAVVACRIPADSVVTSARELKIEKIRQDAEIDT